ncbi:hypothetical protein EJB05_39670, partial [Eragrostis curvula]
MSSPPPLHGTPAMDAPSAGEETPANLYPHLAVASQPPPFLVAADPPSPHPNIQPPPPPRPCLPAAVAFDAQPSTFPLAPDSGHIAFSAPPSNGNVVLVSSSPSPFSHVLPAPAPPHFIFPGSGWRPPPQIPFRFHAGAQAATTPFLYCPPGSGSSRSTSHGGGQSFLDLMASVVSKDVPFNPSVLEVGACSGRHEMDAAREEHCASDDEKADVTDYDEGGDDNTLRMMELTMKVTVRKFKKSLFLTAQIGTKPGNIPVDDCAAERLATWGKNSPFAANGSVMVAIEEALRNSGSKALLFLPKVGMTFLSLGDAYQFYNLYSWELGFSIRLGTNANKSSYVTSDGEKMKNMQEYRCRRAGKPGRNVQSTTRCGCKARLRLLRNKNNEWYVKNFDPDHNHPLVSSCAEKRHLGSHQSIDQSTKNLVRFLRENNVSLGKREVRIRQGWPIQAHAAKIYTKDAYKLFLKELYKSTSYIVVRETHHDGDGDHFIVSHIDADKREQWSKVEFEVHIDQKTKFHSCECGLYNHFGILCCHALLLLVRQGVTTIPDVHIMVRWTKDACAVNPSHLVHVQEISNALDSKEFRSGLIDDAVREFVSLANTDRECFDVAITQLTTVVKKLKKMTDSVRTRCQVGFASSCSEYEHSRGGTSAGYIALFTLLAGGHGVQRCTLFAVCTPKLDYRHCYLRKGTVFGDEPCLSARAEQGYCLNTAAHAAQPKPGPIHGFGKLQSELHEDRLMALYKFLVTGAV